MNTITAQEIKRRGISAVDDALRKGPVHIIKNNKPKYILLEFNKANVYSRVFMKDLINLLDNYSLYRIMPGGKMLELNNPYDETTHEIFGSQNIIFINNNKE